MTCWLKRNFVGWPRCLEKKSPGCKKDMSLETHIASATDRLIDGLHFGGRNTASYVVSRQATTFSPSSAAAWSPSGVRLVRFNLADHSGWLDGTSVRLCMQLTNLSSSATLDPIAVSPACMFRRVRIIGASAVLEDIDVYNRTFQLMSEMSSTCQRRMNDMTESWGGGSATLTLDNPAVDDPIPASSSRQVCVQLMSSFLSQQKLIPLAMCPITIELELDDANAAFSGTTADWQITRPRLLADVCQIDPVLNNSYAKHLLDGKSLPMYMQGIYSMISAVPAGSSLFSLPIARGFTRLSCIYVSFHNGSTDKWVTSFHHPSKDAVANTTATNTLEYNITIGSERYPNFNCESTQESFYRLRLATAAHMGSDQTSITPRQYQTTKFVIGQSFEKTPGQSSHTGINTRSGSQLTLNFKNLGASATCHVVMIFDQVVNLSASGIEVLD